MIPNILSVECINSDNIGKRIDRFGRIVHRVNHDEHGFFMWGPYVKLEAGLYIVSFEITVESVPDDRLGDPVIITLDVSTNMGGTVLAERCIRLAELDQSNGEVHLNVQIKGSREIELRANANGQVSMTVSPFVKVQKLSDHHCGPPKRSPLTRSWDNEREYLDGFLRNVNGVIHVGANTGQERFLYQMSAVDVLWVEAIPSVYESLLDHISGLDRQRAVNALLTDKDGEIYEFNVSNLGGGSSSILPFEQHAVTMPHIQYVENIQLKSVTFPTMIAQEDVDMDCYDALVIDAEGAELLILHAAGDLLKNFRYIKCEVSDFPLRTGDPTVEDIDSFLGNLGFEQLVRKPHGYGVGSNGTFWDIVWKKRWEGEPLHYPETDLPFIATRTWERLGT